MLNGVYFYTMEQPNTSKYHRSNRSSPALPINKNVSQRTTNQTNRRDHLPPLPPRSIVCSAYFLSRADLNDYTIPTLQHTVDSVILGPKSKGLKVKLSLPDDGLIIDNILDSNQSWMYRTSELLYFWQDSRHDNLVVIITKNRRKTSSIDLFSASIFRLRGNESIRTFLQRAQYFFARLSERNNPKISIKKSATTDQIQIHPKRSRHTSKSKEQSFIQHSLSSPNANTQAEFDPRRTTTNNSSLDLYKYRTYSETTISSDNRISPSKRFNSHTDDDDKLTTISNYFANEHVGDLVRELKELRTEITSLKLEHKPSLSVRSISTSPIFISSNKFHREIPSSSIVGIDAQTQTDLTLLDNDIKIELINQNSMTNKRKNEQIIINGNKRILSTSNESTNNELKLINSLNGQQSNSEIYENIPTIFNSKTIDKDSSSIPMDTESSLSFQTGEVVSFRSSLEDTITSPDNIYENIPVFISVNNNQQSSTGKPYACVTIVNDSNTENQQEYLKHLFGPQNGISSLISSSTIGNKTHLPSSSSSSSDISSTLPNNQYFFQQVSFSNHLTNPLFRTDKQLLANTIANQFGLDPNSPELHKLISNQHLFVHNKRTFANVIWPISPEEERILCSSPVNETSSRNINIQIDDSNFSTGKSILKPKNFPRISSKGQRISWDTSSE